MKVLAFDNVEYCAVYRLRLVIFSAWPITAGYEHRHFSASGFWVA